MSNSGNRYPIVFVHGLLGWGSDKLLGLPYFACAPIAILAARAAARDFGLHRRAFFPSVGPISSNHDRACELFYRLKGGDIHYGATHAEHHGHRESVENKRSALYPDWSAERPLHFVGQALGAPTVRLLQHLLSLGDFFVNPQTGKPYPTSANWIRSITSISGIHNGTTTAYILGCSPDNGRILSFSTVEYLASTLFDTSRRTNLTSRIQNSLFPVDLEQWSDPEAFLRGEDNAAFDLSIHGAQQLDVLQDHPRTHYFSFLTSKTESENGTGSPQVPKAGMNMLFRYTAAEMGRFGTPLRNLKYPVDEFAPWWQNDGLAPVFAQDYPRWGSSRTSVQSPNGPPYEPGIWHIMETLDMDHMNTVALPRWLPPFRDQFRQIHLYRRIYQLLSSLPG